LLSNQVIPYPFFCRAKDIANRLSDLDQPYTEPAKIAKLMSCLPSDYDLVIALFKERSGTLGVDTMSLDAFQTSMQQREAELESQSAGKKADKVLQARTGGVDDKPPRGGGVGKATKA
jgi:hypothetical protein